MQIHDNLREDLCQDNHPAAWAVSIGLAEAPDEELCRKATSVVAEALAPYREEDAES